MQVCARAPRPPAARAILALSRATGSAAGPQLRPPRLPEFQNFRLFNHSWVWNKNDENRTKHEKTLEKRRKIFLERILTRFDLVSRFGRSANTAEVFRCKAANFKDGVGLSLWSLARY